MSHDEKKHDDKKHVTAMSVKMDVVITQNSDGTLNGNLNCKYFEEPFTFTRLMSMVEMMETTFDTKGFPEKHLLPRSFNKPKKRLRKHELDLPTLAKERSAEIDDASLAVTENQIKKTCSFDLLVRFRHNAEWQGSIFWKEADNTKRFSSIVELVRIINEALSR